MIFSSQDIARIYYVDCDNSVNRSHINILIKLFGIESTIHSVI